jgi:hypothetical protein
VYAIFILLVSRSATCRSGDSGANLRRAKELLVLLFLRIYAVVYLVLFLEGVALLPAQATQPTLIQLIDLVFFTPVAVLGLWSAGYRHLNLPKHGWKVLLFASVFWRPFAIGNAVLSGNVIAKFQTLLGAVTAKMSGDAALLVMLLATAAVCFLGSLVILPPLVALYRNAYGDESLLKLMSPHPRPKGAVAPADRLADIAARREAQRSIG